MPKSLLTHVMIGSNDVARAKVFYDAALAALGFGFGLGTDAGTHVYYMHGDGPALGIGKPLNGEAATVGNGLTRGFPAENEEAVDAFHATGLAHGETNEGTPGPKAFGAGSSYGAYLRDPDGNKISAYAR